MKNNLYHIGYIFDTFRLQGQVKFTLESWIINFKFNKIKTLHLIHNETVKIVPLDKFKNIKNYWILKLSTINHINQIKDFKKAQVFVNKTEYNLATRQWYFPEMIDYKLMVDDQEQGKLINYFRQNKVIIGEFRDGKKSFLVPMIKEYLLTKNDLNQTILGKSNILEVKKITLSNE